MPAGMFGIGFEYTVELLCGWRCTTRRHQLPVKESADSLRKFISMSNPPPVVVVGEPMTDGRWDIGRSMHSRPDGVFKAEDVSAMAVVRAVNLVSS